MSPERSLRRSGAKKQKKHGAHWFGVGLHLVIAGDTKCLPFYTCRSVQRLLWVAGFFFRRLFCHRA